MKRIEDILALCIEEIKAGKATLTDCLERHPSVRRELEPLLRIALSIPEPPLITPSDAFRVRTRVQLMEHIHAQKGQRKSLMSVSGSDVRQTWYAGWLKTVAIVVAILLAVSAVGTGTAYASQDSLPGDTLYPVKTSTEQVRRLLTTDDNSRVDLELTFAGVRLQEIEALADKAPDRLSNALNGYEKNTAMAITEADQIKDGSGSAGALERVALATSNHLLVLDRIEDSAPENAEAAIRQTKEIAIREHVRALQSLARRNPVRAAEINIDTMQGRLNRARVQADKDAFVEVEEALRQFEQLRRFGEEISETARGLGYGAAAVDELNARATSAQLEVLGIIYGQVPGETRGAVEEAMGVSVEGHGQAVKGLQDEGALKDIPEEPPVPEQIPDDVKKRILQPEPKGPGNGKR
ncbi:DUF5667 domain-containing protein [Chloroflexota bacterium]